MSGEMSSVLGGKPGKISWPGPGVCQGWWKVGERRDSLQRRRVSDWSEHCHCWPCGRGRWKKLIAWFELFYEVLSRSTISFMYFNINIQVFYSRTLINGLLLILIGHLHPRLWDNLHWSWWEIVVSGVCPVCLWLRTRVYTTTFTFYHSTSSSVSSTMGLQSSWQGKGERSRTRSWKRKESWLINVKLFMNMIDMYFIIVLWLLI